MQIALATVAPSQARQQTAFDPLTTAYYVINDLYLKTNPMQGVMQKGQSSCEPDTTRSTDSSCEPDTTHSTDSKHTAQYAVSAACCGGANIILCGVSCEAAAETEVSQMTSNLPCPKLALLECLPHTFLTAH